VSLDLAPSAYASTEKAPRIANTLAALLPTFHTHSDEQIASSDHGMMRAIHSRRRDQSATAVATKTNASVNQPSTRSCDVEYRQLPMAAAIPAKGKARLPRGVKPPSIVVDNPPGPSRQPCDRCEHHGASPNSVRLPLNQGEAGGDQEILVLGQYCRHEQADGQARPAGDEGGDRCEGEAQTERIGCEHPHAEPCTRVHEDAEQRPERERTPGGDVPDRAARNCEAGCRQDDQAYEEGLPVEDTEPEDSAG
jgi:hypothetical protein